MDIRGIVHTIIMKAVGMMERVWYAWISVWTWLWNSITAFGIALKTHTVASIKHAVIQWSIGLYRAVTRTPLVWLIKLAIIIVNPIHSVLGILHQKTVVLHQRLVLKLQKLEE